VLLLIAQTYPEPDEILASLDAAFAGRSALQVLLPQYLICSLVNSSKYLLLRDDALLISAEVLSELFTVWGTIVEFN
jgi:hypothetical protein